VAHTVQCLKAGRHVFIEKPVSLTLKGFDEIIAAERDSGKTVFVGYMRRYAEAFLRVKSMVQKVPKDGIAFGVWLNHYRSSLLADV
jgi:predicted dehydrogenase